MSDESPAEDALLKQNIQYCLYKHKNTVESLDQAACERGQSPSQVIRSILFRSGTENFILVLVAGFAQVSWPKLRVNLGVSRITLATESEVLQITGYRVGSVTPLGIARPLRILADYRIFEPKEISIGSGKLGIAIIMKSVDLTKIVNNIEISSIAADITEYH